MITMEAEMDFLQYKANLLRMHSLKMTTKAGSGHPTSCFSCAEIMSVLFFKEMNYDPENMAALDNDEFVMSKGHAAPILYAALAEAGALPNGDIFSLRSFESRIEGHPVPRIPGVRVATGSLGQGLSAAVGMALSMKMDGIERRVYVLIGDGEAAEGSVWEAMNLAPHLRLDNLCAILDMNRLGQSDATMHQWNSKTYAAKARSFGWHAIVVDGHSVEKLIKAFAEAKKQKKPAFIIAKTVKGKGVSFLENKDGYHGKPVDKSMEEKAADEIQKFLKPVKWKPKNFIRAKRLLLKVNEPKNIITNYKIGDSIATREAYGRALEKLGADASMVVLDGDVKNSTFTEFFFKKYPERSVQCYIAEQSMIGIALGLQARGKNVFAATFAAFLSRAFDQMRMAAYSRASLKLAGSHCGVSIGEDGPSQMGLEDIGMTRLLLNSIVLYPSDAVSSEKLTALSANYNGISYMRTTRSKTPVIYSNNEEFAIGGSKTLRSSNSDKATVVAAGITVHEALKAADELRKEGINVRVIDAYSIKPVDAATLLKAAKETKAIVTAEDHYAEGGLGEAVASIVRCPVHILAVTKMPHSGRAEELMAEQGIDKNGIIRKVKEILSL